MRGTAEASSSRFFSGSLILTAAVSPNVAGRVTVASPTVRLAQYQEFLRQWHLIATALSFDLVVIETTGFGAEDLLSVCDIQNGVGVDFTPTAAQRSAGKGAVEAAALLRYVSSMPPNSVALKATGRVFVQNWRQISPSIFDVAGTNRVLCRMVYGRPYFDTRFFAARAEILQRMLDGAPSEIDDLQGVYFEHVMGARLVSEIARGKAIHAQFSQRPYFEGRSGSTGAQYKRSELHNLYCRVSGRFEASLLRIIRAKAV